NIRFAQRVDLVGTSREWVRNQQQIASLLLAPAASVPIAKLNEIDGPIELILPFAVKNLPDAVIDKHKAARAQQRIHGVVVQPNVSIKSFLNVQVLDQGDGNLAPNLHHSRK